MGLLAFLVLYILAGKLGLAFAFVNASASPVWAPSGLALAACLVKGPRVWPAVFVGAFVVNVTTAGSIGTSLGIAVGNTLEAVLGALLVNRLAGGVRAFEHAPGIFKFVFAALASATVSATIGVTTLALAGYADWAAYRPVWMTWWLGDATGDVIIAPVALLWSLDPYPRWIGARRVEAAVVLVALVFFGLGIFTAPVLPGYPLLLVCFVPLIWVALRFGVREVATGIAILSMIATWATVRGEGPLVMESPNDSLLALQAFMALMALLMLPVAALVEEQRRIANESDVLRQAAEAERQTLAAAHEAQSRLVAIVQGSDDAIIGTTLHGVITSWNRGAEKMFGHRAAEAIGQRVTLIVPADRAGEEDAVLRRIREGEHVEYFQTIRVNKSGGLLPVSLTVSPVRNEAGYIVGVSEIARDVTERVRREATTRFLDEAGIVLTSSLDYVATLRTLARIAIPTMADFCAVDMLTDHGPIERLAAAHVDPVKERLAEMLIERHPLRPGARYGVPEVLRTGTAQLHPDPPPWMRESSVRAEEDRNTLRTFAVKSLMIVPIVARGRTLGAITFVSADSGRRYGEEDLVLAQDLARRAAIAVDNARLYREAQEANQAKDQFLAVLSHELRTPLTSVLGWARMLTTGQLRPDRVGQALEAIERNARHQAELINDLLDVSRISAGKLQLDLRPLDLVPLIEQAIDAPAGQATAKGVTVETHLDASVGLVAGDPVRLQQVIANLVGNALKFTGRGGQVHVSLEGDGDAAQIVVRDTGIGLAAETLPHIFEAFRQADSSATREHGGLGLGLAIVRSLVTLHGGTVTAASEGRGKGATFTVRLPIVQPAPGPSLPRGGRRQAEPSDTKRLAGLQVLLVENDADSRDLLAGVLGAQGADVIAVGGVDDALAIANRQPIDVLVSDIGMVGKSGYDLITAVRALRSSIASVPAIAVTALATDEDRENVLAAGFQEHVPKPIDPVDLVDIVARVTRRNG